MKIMKKTLCTGLLSLLLVLSLVLPGCTPPKKADVTDYSITDNWAYYEADVDKKVDVFFICPTVFKSDENNNNMTLTDDETKKKFLGAINMEKGIYDADARVYAPYYRQISMGAYNLSEDPLKEAKAKATSDVVEAFRYYMEKENNGRPVILAGFSQGSEMALNLLKEYSDNDTFQKQIVAAYLIGWRVTDKDLKDFPSLKMAKGQNDTGVIVSFDCEAPSITSTMIVPENTKTNSINPLNWKTDGTPASASENKGACFTDYSGSITKEIPALCGAAIDPTRGTLKIQDVSVEAYPAKLSILPEGSFHIYDYQFFYRNLQENVKARLDAYLAQ